MGLFGSDEEEVEKDLVKKRAKATTDRTRIMRNSVEAHRNSAAANMHRQKLAQNDKTAAEIEKMREATEKKMQELELEEVAKKRELDAEEEIRRMELEKEQREEIDDVKKVHAKKEDEHKEQMERLRQEQASIGQNIEKYNERYLEEKIKETEKTDKLTKELIDKEEAMDAEHNLQFLKKEEEKLGTELQWRQVVNDKEAAIYEKAAESEKQLLKGVIETQKIAIFTKLANASNVSIREVNDALGAVQTTAQACNNDYVQFTGALAEEMDSATRTSAKLFLKAIDTQVKTLSEKLVRLDDKKKYIGHKEGVETMKKTVLEVKRSIRDFQMKSGSVAREFNKPASSKFDLKLVTDENDGLDAKMLAIMNAIDEIDKLTSENDKVRQAAVFGTNVPKQPQQITDN